MKTPVTRLSRIVSLTALALAPFAAAAAAAFVATAGTASAAPTGASLAAAPAPPPHTLAELATRFTAPPDEYKPRVWWHWMGPNFTKTGITKDLEAMREAG
ncbi:MAG: hypothetical protein LBT53_03305, partial [Puniceicoccales bacterium]|nr:hypothetical protein [Puniceicoccales bacterium]